MKKFLVVLLTCAVLFGVFMVVVPRLLERAPEPEINTPQPAPAAPAPRPEAESMMPESPAAGQLRALIAEFDAGRIESAWNALEALQKVDTGVLSASQQARLADIAGVLTPARAHFIAATTRLAESNAAKTGERMDEARRALDQALSELQAITGVPNFHWSETPLGKAIQAALAALTQPAAAISEEAWQAQVMAAMRVRQSGTTEEALAALQALLPHAPANRKAWLAREIQQLDRLRQLEEERRNMPAGTVEDIPALLENGQYHRGLAALNVLSEKAATGAERERIAELKKTAQQMLQRKQTDLRKQSTEVEQLIDLAGRELSNKRFQEADEAVTRASDILVDLEKVQRDEPEYDLDVTRLRRSITTTQEKVNEEKIKEAP